MQKTGPHPGKLLVLGHQWPEPEATAAGQRMLQLLRGFLSRGYHITFASAAAPGKFDFPLETLGIEKIPVALNDPSFDRVLQTGRYTVVLFDRFITEEQFGWRVREQLPECILILDTEDLHSLRHSRENAIRRGGQWTPEDWTAEPVFYRELASILRCDLSLIISAAEAQLLTGQVPLTFGKLLYLPFQFGPVTEQEGPDFGKRTDFVFVGNGKHRPNADAIRQLKKEIWPLLSEMLPHASLHIYGAYLPEGIRAMNAPRERFLVHGWAPRLEPVLSKSRLQLAPLRFGAGIKGKILNALQFGLPTLSTPIGWEGICGATGRDGFAADSARDFAEKAAALYRSPEEWKEALEYQRTAAAAHFGDAMEVLFDWIEIPEERPAPLEPTQLILQNMLRNEAFDRVRYLSKWIEAKAKG